MMNTHENAAARSSARRAIFARLVSEENIAIEFSDRLDTAAFDVINRKMLLPVWNIDDDFFDMLIMHETGHALFTPGDAWVDTAAVDPRPELAPIIRHYFNAIEDARIERLMLAKYPGAKRVFAKAYAEAHEGRDMFGVKGMSAGEFDALPFVDRINLHFKLGRYGMLPTGIVFSATERAILDRIAKAETFDDVIDITRDIFEAPQSMPPQPQNGDGDKGAGDDSDDDDDSDSNDTGDGMSQSSGGESDDSDSDDSNGIGESGDSSDSDGESGGSADDSDDSDDGDDSSEPSDSAPSSDHGITGAMEKSRTIDKFDSALKSSAMKNDNTTASSTTVLNINTENSNEFVRETGEIVAAIRCRKDASTLADRYREFVKDSRGDIAFYASAFNRKKAADEHRRTSIHKSGAIDTNRLTQFKWSEEIFKRNSRVADGKNHGFVFLVDWSGSMSPIFHETIKQLLMIVSFCRMEKIPFEVYRFTDTDQTRYGNLSDMKPGDRDDHRDRMAKKYSDMAPIDDYSLSRSRGWSTFFLDTLLDDRMSKADFETVAGFMLLFSESVSNYYSMTRSFNRYDDACPIDFALCSTPLQESMLIIRDRMLRFRDRSRAQILNLVCLTDGDANPTFSSRGDNLVISERDTHYRSIKGSIRYAYSNKDYADATTELLNWVRATTGANIVNFYLDGVGDGGRWFYDIDDSGELKKELKSKMSVSTGPQDGWDDVYVLKITISGRRRRRGSDRKSKDIAPGKNGYTVTQLTKIVENETKARQAHRNIMNSFMTLVAGNKRRK